MADTAHTARLMWTLVEPIHAVTYFAPAGRSAYEQAGLRGFWRGYFAGRAAPLGPAGPAVVTASFYNFAPAFVARAIPAVWELIAPEEALRTRTAGAVTALGALLDGREAEVAAAADLLWQAVGELDCAGRVLAAANVALPADHLGQTGSPDLARLWQAATVLREHRGDGHFAAWPRRTSTAARRWPCGAARTCGGRTCSRCEAGPIRSGTTRSAGSPTAAGSPRPTS